MTTLKDILRALFIDEGRLFGVRSIVFLALTGALIWFTYEGIIPAEAFIGILASAGTFYFVERSE